MDSASINGLENLSLGQLATDIGMSKSGIFALFGSKEVLQLATIRSARRIYFDQIIIPSQAFPPGIGKTLNLCENWLAYSRNRVFPGGCFFYGVAAEFDARPGAVRDLIVEANTFWSGHVAQTLAEARAVGDLLPDTDVEQLAFELIGLLETANSLSLLHDDNTPYRRAGQAILNRLRSVSTDPGTLPAEPGPSAFALVDVPPTGPRSQP